MNQELINAINVIIKAINAQINQTVETFESIIGSLKFGEIFRIKYVKNDGEEVERLGVIEEFGFNLDGKKFKIDIEKIKNTGYFKYYDLTKDGWRCCRTSSIKEITFSGVKHTF